MNSSNGFNTATFGYNGTVPVVGDFDGDGNCDFGCYDAKGNLGQPAGSWYLMCSTAGYQATAFGYNGTVPVVGDFDGDGNCDFGCYDAKGNGGALPGSWYFMESTAGFKTATFGYNGTVPVVGDYDGDGTNDYGCYDAKGNGGALPGSWYFMNSTAGFQTTTFGYNGTVPVGSYVQDPSIIIWDREGVYYNGWIAPVYLPFTRDWVIEGDMVNLYPPPGFARYFFNNGNYGIDFFLGAQDLALRLANQAIWFTSANLGGVCNPYPPALDDHVGQTLPGSYRSGNHRVRIEYLLSANPDPKRGVCRLYWDGTKIGDWNFWVDWFPNSMTSWVVGYYPGHGDTFDHITLRSYSGDFTSLDDLD